MELLIVMVIIIVLTAAMISGLGNSQRVMNFLGAQESFFNVLRNTRTYAVTGRSVPDYNDFDGDGNYDEQVTPANWGIYINTTDNRVVLFADLRANPSGKPVEGSFQDPGKGILNTYYAALPNGNDIIVSETKISDDIMITITPTVNPVINTVFFSPIFADVKFNTALSSTAKFLTIKMTSKSLPSLKTCYLIHPIAGNPEPYPADMTCP